MATTGIVKPPAGILPPRNRCEHAVVGICGKCWRALQDDQKEGQ